MRMPRLMSGWVTTDRKVHDTREAATVHECREQMVTALRDHIHERRALYGLGPEEAADIVLDLFDLQPKVIDAEPPPATNRKGK